jgi:hypothetical protein
MHGVFCRKLTQVIIQPAHLSETNRSDRDRQAIPVFCVWDLQKWLTIYIFIRTFILRKSSCHLLMDPAHHGMDINPRLHLPTPTRARTPGEGEASVSLSPELPDVPRYRYPELREKGHTSRLLTLHPGSSKDVVHVELGQVRLDGACKPEYEALSYTWGSAISFAPLRMGHLGQSVLMITKNLHDALTHLRYPDTTRILWVDSICINQSDLNERGSQVAQMGEVFRQASRVIIWLGCEEGDSSYALELIEGLSSQIAEYDWLAMKMLLKDPGKKIHMPIGRREAQALDKLIRRSWFERLWVRQEISLARDALIMCGNRTLPWRAFKNAVGALEYEDAFAYHWEDPLSWEKRLRLISELCRSPKYFLSEIRARLTEVECSDPRDRIYGILPLLTDDLCRIGVTPNYTLSTAEVYEDITIRYIQSFDSIDILRECEWNSFCPIPDLPTWVPDWSSKKASNRARFGPTKASSNLSAVIRSHGCGTLSLGAVRAGRVSAVMPIYSLGSWNPGIIPSRSEVCKTEQTIRGLWDTACQLDVEHPVVVDSEKLLDSFCEILGCGYFQGSQIPLELPLPDFKKCRQTLETILNSEPEDDSIHFISSETDLPRHWIELLKKFRVRCRDRCFLVTEHGNIGLGPLFTRPGDEVAVFLGLYSVMTVRRDESRDAYQIVGEAYIPGLNGGEAIFGDPDECECKLVDVYDQSTDSFLTWYSNKPTRERQLKDPKLAKFSLDVSAYEEMWTNGIDARVKISIADLQHMGIQAEYLKLV